MIIFKNYNWQMNSSFPDFDYTKYNQIYNEETSSFVLKEKKDYVETDNPVVYVIPDDSPLATLVMQYAPNMQIIADENGNVINVIEYYPIEEVIKNKQQ